MAGTYSQIYLQFIFVVKRRDNLLKREWREEVFKYISGIISEKGHKSIIVNGVEDHVHCFVGFKPAGVISDLMRDIKNNSSKFINERKFLKVKFSWQPGYAVFSYSHSQVERVYDYILNQEKHHQNKTFQEEYVEFLEKYGVSYDPKYLFDVVK